MQIRNELQAVGRQTGLLFEFVTEQNLASVIDEWQFAALHASLLAAEWTAVEAVVSIDATEEREGSMDIINGELALIEETAPRALDVELVLDREGVLRLLGPTSFLSATFPATVIVGDGSGSATLGPDCFICAGDIELHAETIDIRRRVQAHNDPDSEEPSVELAAMQSFAATGTLIGNPSAGVFQIAVPSSARLVYPWVSYRTELQVDGEAPDERAVRFLKMLMNLMRNHGHAGRPAVYDKKLEGRQSIKQGAFTDVVSRLEGMGVLSKEGSLIFLQPDWQQHRFSGTAQPGIATLEDKLDVWSPVLDEISRAVST